MSPTLRKSLFTLLGILAFGTAAVFPDYAVALTSLGGLLLGKEHLRSSK